MDHADFIAAVVAAPDDDAPRRAYADWLTARGDIRGQFITEQLRTGERWVAQAAVADIGRDHYRSWMPTVAGIGSPVWRRGFIESVFMNPREFLAGAETLFAQTPLRRVVLYGEVDPPTATAIGALGCLTRLRGLALVRETGARAFSVLTASPNLKGIEDLELSDCRIGDEGARALAASRWPLQTLSMTDCEVGPGGITALADSPVLADITSLNLTGNPLGEGVGALGRSTRLGRVRHLILRQVKADAHGAAALAQASSLGALETLDLTKNWIEDAGAAALAAETGLPRLRRLNLEEAGLSSASGAAFGLAAGLRGLVDLDLRRNHIGEEGAEALAAGPGLPSLKRLGLSHNPIYVPGESEIWTDWDGSVVGSGPVKADGRRLHALYGRRFAVD